MKPIYRSGGSERTDRILEVVWVAIVVLLLVLAVILIQVKMSRGMYVLEETPQGVIVR